jgi:hypothetical protein
MSEGKKHEPRGLPIPIPDADSCPPKMAKMIDGLLCGDELSAKQQLQLDQALRERPAVRAYYDRAMLAERMLSGGPEALLEPSPAQLARLESSILDRVEVETAESAAAERAKSRSGLLGWIAGLVAVGAALAIALPTLLSEENRTPKPSFSGRPDPGEFQARGTPAKRGKLVGLRVFCIDKQASPPVRELSNAAAATTAAGAKGDIPSCPLRATLRFAYTNRSALKRLFLVGVDAESNPLWYAPVPPNKQSITAARGVDKALPRAVRLAVNHKPGVTRVYAVFSNKALTTKTVRAAIETIEKGSVGSQKLLPIDDTEQRSLLLKIVR